MAPDPVTRLPVKAHEAMIRELHVYGKVAQLHETADQEAESFAQQDAQAQHLGLGRQLIAKACELAASEGYTKLNVISSVGTREYYRKLGFADQSLYQQIALN
jgi:elongator complex protein 3